MLFYSTKGYFGELSYRTILNVQMVTIVRQVLLDFYVLESTYYSRVIQNVEELRYYISI